MPKAKIKRLRQDNAEYVTECPKCKKKRKNNHCSKCNLDLDPYAIM